MDPERHLKFVREYPQMIDIHHVHKLLCLWIDFNRGPVLSEQFILDFHLHCPWQIRFSVERKAVDRCDRGVLDLAPFGFQQSACDLNPIVAYPASIHLWHPYALINPVCFMQVHRGKRLLPNPAQ
jgi:hypothetical protein